MYCSFYLLYTCITAFRTRNERCILTTNDLTGPTPCTYSPPRKGLQETNSPAYTMGFRCKGRVGGGRTAWSKPWFATDSVWTVKTRYESNWPSVMDYDIPVTLGNYVCFGNQQPSFTMQSRKNFAICRQDTKDEPAPNAYCRESSERAVLKQAPAYTFPRVPASRHLWQFISDTPGPGAYDPYMYLCRPRSLSFSFGLTGKRFQ